MIILSRCYMGIEWCKRRGLKLIEPNDNLAEEYYRNAEETLRVVNLIKDSGSNMWLATQKYYAEYLAAYSLLMKFGIDSEIHSCTIEVIKLLEKEKIVSFSLSKVLEEDKELRIDNQYYLKNKHVDLNPSKISQLLLRIREILDGVTPQQIQRIRELV